MILHIYKKFSRTFFLGYDLYLFKNFKYFILFYIDDHDCTTLQWNDSSDGGKNAIGPDENN